MEEIKKKFADLIMKHGAPLAMAVAFIIYIDYKDSNQEKVYLEVIKALREDKVNQLDYNRELIEEVIECYKSTE